MAALLRLDLAQDIHEPVIRVKAGQDAPGPTIMRLDSCCGGIFAERRLDETAGPSRIVEATRLGGRPSVHKALGAVQRLQPAVLQFRQVRLGGQMEAGEILWVVATSSLELLQQ